MSDIPEQPAVIPRKTRRRHSQAFKEQIVAECRESGESVAAIARRHGLNDNLIHNWRRQLGREGKPDFIRLPAPAAHPDRTAAATSQHTLLRIELPSPNGPIVAHWPMAEIDRSVPWLKALMR